MLCAAIYVYKHIHTHTHSWFFCLLASDEWIDVTELPLFPCLVSHVHKHFHESNTITVGGLALVRHRPVCWGASLFSGAENLLGCPPVRLLRLFFGPCCFGLVFWILVLGKAAAPHLLNSFSRVVRSLVRTLAKIVTKHFRETLHFVVLFGDLLAARCRVFL